MHSFNYNPDIISCLANLSTDEVFTSPSLANSMLDLLPNELWENPNARFLDPACKSGVFLREIAKRLNSGLEKVIPNTQDRLNHIFEKQIFGIAITELTALLSRRSLYCSKQADGKYSVCNVFKNDEGNILFRRIEHQWIRGKCSICGANEQMFRRDSQMESHAYEFIHDGVPEKWADMKFDVIIGNPPYHLTDSGDNVGASPIYHRFVEQAKKLNPHFISMIIPSRWFAGGKGLDSFRSDMLSDDSISHLVDYPVTADVFPGLKVIGGVCYFLWDSQHKGPCEVTTVMNGDRDVMIRKLNQFESFVRFNKAISILEKVNKKNYPSLSAQVSSQKPFGLRTYEAPSGRGEIILYANKQRGRIEHSKIVKGHALVERWKVLLSMGYGEGGETRDYPRNILGKPIIAEPGSACTETYIVIDHFENEQHAKNLAAYLRTRFLRFLVGLKKNTQHVSKDKFNFVPRMAMTQKWTDEKLYDHFGLTQEEILFIESIIRPGDDADD
jgi:site-specific DNA-methyltransferase (adenine-specific)